MSENDTEPQATSYGIFVDLTDLDVRAALAGHPPPKDDQDLLDRIAAIKSGRESRP